MCAFLAPQINFWLKWIPPVNADIPPVLLGKKTKDKPRCPSQTTARNVWEDNRRMLAQLIRDASISLLATGEGCWKEAQMHKKTLSQSWLQRRELWRAHKLFLFGDWRVGGDGVDRWHLLPYLVLWIKLLVFCCCCRSHYPGEGAQAQQNLFHSCLAVQERWIGKGQESKQDWGHIGLTNISKHGAC